MNASRQNFESYSRPQSSDEGDALLHELQGIANAPATLEGLSLPDQFEKLTHEASKVASLVASHDRVTTQLFESRVRQLAQAREQERADVARALVSLRSILGSMHGLPSSADSKVVAHSLSPERMVQSASLALNRYRDYQTRKAAIPTGVFDDVANPKTIAVAGVLALIAFPTGHPVWGVLCVITTIVLGWAYLEHKGRSEQTNSLIDGERKAISEIRSYISRCDKLEAQSAADYASQMQRAEEARDITVTERQRAYDLWLTGFQERAGEYSRGAWDAHPSWPTVEPDTFEEIVQKEMPGVDLNSDPNVDSFREILLKNHNYWTRWTPPKQKLPAVSIGEMHVLVTEPLTQSERFPTMVPVPSGMSLHFVAEDGEPPVVSESMIMRFVTAFPPGRLRLTLIDPVGNGSNFAGLMHLGDHNPALIGEAAWVEPRHIEEQLARLSEQMRTIIQKYLKRDFETMEDYNEYAQSIEEPYRLVVINNFPSGFSSNALANLRHLLANGQRAGIYVMLAMASDAEVPRGFELSAIDDASKYIFHRMSVEKVGLTREESTVDHIEYVRKPDHPAIVYQSVRSPSTTLQKKLMEQVSHASLGAGVVKVPFAEIAPKPDEWWTGNTTHSLSPVVGFHGARKPQHVNFGRNALGGDLNNGALIVGRVGSGKSTLLHSIIMGLATTYSPEELELYLIDSKQGIEFNVYSKFQLPHARAISVETEPEFTASVILRLAAEMELRAKRIKESVGDTPSAQNIGGFREVTGERMSRIVMVIDEFQELYSESSPRIAEAQQALEQIIRQGRAYGIHLILATQTFGGGVGMPKSIRELVAVRIAMMTSEADAAMIFQDDNTEARLLDRPGEAILNESFGRVEANQRFQTGWMESEDREKLLRELRQRADTQFPHLPRPVVFSGGSSSSLAANPDFIGASPTTGAPTMWLGSSIAIEPDYKAVLRQNAGANLLIVGERESSIGMLVSAIAAAVRTSRDAILRIVDAGGEDTGITDHLEMLASMPARDIRVVAQRGAIAMMEELDAELTRRLDLDSTRSLPSILLVIPVIDRVRSLRRETSPSYGAAADEFNPSRAFIRLLAEGPEVGIHVIAQADSVSSLNRVVTNPQLDQFDIRVVTQVSRDDSQRVIDSPEASHLGSNRAIVFLDDRNSRTRIKPYGVPNLELLRETMMKAEPVPSAGE